MTFIRLVVPDSHGVFIDREAERAFLADAAHLDPKEIVLLGDHIDASGIFSVHQPHSIEDRAYSYAADCAAANTFLDKIQRAAPDAAIDYIEGNHESHLCRWISRLDLHRRDMELFEAVLAPRHMLKLRDRGIKYHASTERHMGLAIPGTIKRGRCFFAHGYATGRAATASHLAAFGGNIVFGHIHRSSAIISRTVASGEIGAWCPGTLAQLQPLYAHTGLTGWSHGYGLQLVENSGRFLHINVPIVRGRSLLRPLLSRAA